MPRCATPAQPAGRAARAGRIRSAALACSLGLALLAPLHAEPDAGDRVAQFLGERGLVETPAPTPNTGEAQGLASRLREQAGAASDWASDLVIASMNFLGVPYKRGGQTAEQGFDCSGFTRHVFEASIGLVLPRRSKEQAQASALKPVEREELRPGDLVFFNTLRSAFSHVGIYIGDGKFIHSPRSGSEVRVEDMRLAYWNKRYNGARRAERTVHLQGVPAATLQATMLPPLSAVPQQPPARLGNGL